MRRNKQMDTFTLFIALPSEKVCTLRDLPSGICIRDVQCRLEVAAGIPAGIYSLKGNTGKELSGEHTLELGKNVWDGFLIRAQLLDFWQSVFGAVCRGDVSWLLRNVTILQTKRDDGSRQSDQLEPSLTVDERSSTILYLASWAGSTEICQALLAIGADPNGRTAFHRTPIFAAVAGDHVDVVETLLNNGATLGISDSTGTTPADVAKRRHSRQCIKIIRQYELARRNLALSFSKSHSTIDAPSILRTQSEEKLSSNISGNSPTTQPRTCDPKNRSQTAKSYTERKQNSLRGKNHSTEIEGKAACSPSRINGIIRQKPIQIDAPQLGFLNRAPSSVASSSPRGSERLSNTPRSSTGVRFRIGTADYNALNNKKSLKSQHCVTWNDPLADTEFLSIEPARQSGENKNRYQSMSYAQYTHDLHASRNTKNSKNKSLILDLENRPQTTVGIRYQGTVDPSFENVHGEFVTTTKDSELAERNVKVDNENQENSSPTTDQNAGDRNGHSRNFVSQRYYVKSRYKRTRTESIKTATRRIQLAETQKRATTADSRRRIPFDQWLKRKNREARRACSDTDSDESSDDSDNERNSEAFENWLKELKARTKYQTNPQSVASLHKRKTRAIHGLIGMNDQAQNLRSATPDTTSYMHAWKEWRRSRKKFTGETFSGNMDISTAKKLLGDKNQQLLATAITFDEWMAHTEDREQLIQIIQNASKEKSERNEETNSSRRTGKKITFQQWRTNLDERETKLKNQKQSSSRGKTPDHQKKEVHFVEPVAQKQHPDQQEQLQQPQQLSQQQEQQQRPTSGLRRGPVSECVSTM